MQQRTAVVTGASRGAGRGIAAALGATGATVYVTGRSTRAGVSALPGTIHDTARQVTEAGGKGIAVACDHADDAQVAALFRRVREEAGRIDILVNSATAIPDELAKPGPFWLKPRELVDVLNVGLRSAYIATYEAAEMLIAARGLVASISSIGANCYVLDPAYGAGKAGLDKMMADMAHDFRPFGVAAVSLWPGPLLTERAELTRIQRPDLFEAMFSTAETPEFSGMVIDAIARDPERMTLSGQTHYVAELALRYGIVDVNGRQPPSLAPLYGAPRQVHAAVVG